MSLNIEKMTRNRMKIIVIVHPHCVPKSSQNYVKKNEIFGTLAKKIR